DTSRIRHVRAVVDEHEATLIARVITAHDGRPTGQVLFTVMTPTGTQTYVATVRHGVARVTLRGLPPGSYTITGVQYLGDANVLASPVLPANLVFTIRHYHKDGDRD